MIRRFVALLAAATTVAVAVASPAQAIGINPPQPTNGRALILLYRCVPMDRDIYPVNGYLVTSRDQPRRGLFHVDGASLSMHQLAQYGGPLTLRYKCAR